MLRFTEWPGKKVGLERSWHWNPRTERKGLERRAEVQAESQGGFHGGIEMKVVGADWSEHGVGVGVPSWLEEGVQPKQAFRPIPAQCLLSLINKYHFYCINQF